MSNQPHQMQMKRGFTFGGSLDDAALLACMTKYFGHHVFRSHQLDIVKSLLNGNDAFCTMATGSGKSLLFQLPLSALNISTNVLFSPQLLICQMY